MKKALKRMAAAALVTLPLRYMHTPAEVCSLKDWSMKLLLKK